MEKKSPIQIETIQICSLTKEELVSLTLKNITPVFDDRRDLLIDDLLAGVAIKLDLYNARHLTCSKQGVRRTLSLTLFDMTERCEINILDVNVSIPKWDTYKSVTVHYDNCEIHFAHNHTYKIVVRDKKYDEVIDSLIFHTYAQGRYGHPVNWYTVVHGGIRPADSDQLYRSVEVKPHTDLNLRFNLEHNFGDNTPAILPELEIRLYRPSGDTVDVKFVEPHLFQHDMPMCDVEMEFMSLICENGIHYAELLCMEYPIAGFVFSTYGPEIHDIWFGQGMEPLGEYSYKAAENRYLRLVATRHENLDEEDTETDGKDKFDDAEFDRLLDEFIASELEAIAQEKGGDDAEEYTTQGPIAVEIPEVTDQETPETGEEPTAMETLEKLTGLSSVKEKISRYEKLVTFNKMRTDIGLPSCNLPLHAMFKGAPGTGKTTVAKLMGKMLHRVGLLSVGHVVVRERATLLGQNYSSESENTVKALEEARGGILFIDEAYQLYQPNDPRDPGKFVIESLLTALADESNRDWMLILAGYSDKMDAMFEINPGLKSRIPQSNIYTFDNFTEEELIEIAVNYLSDNGYTLTSQALEALKLRVHSDWERADDTFGNARHVINLIQTDILPAMAERIIDSHTEDTAALSLVEACDIPSPSIPSVAPRARIGFCA